MRRLAANRILIECEGDAVDGLLIGSVSKDGLDLFYQIGFGSGEAQLKKVGAGEAIS